MKKSITIIISCLFIFSSISGCVNTTAKGYELPKRNTPILVDSVLNNENKYEFSTVVKLEDENNLTGTILKINLITEIKLDSNNKYILENSKLDIEPIGCNIYSIDNERIEGNRLTQNYQIGVKQNEEFNKSMEIGYAKLLIDDSNIRINSISSIDDSLNINTYKDLERFKDNSKIVSLNFTNLNNYFSAWYQIKFDLNSKDKGTFTVF